jgi:hypothetical protein
VDEKAIRLYLKECGLQIQNNNYELFAAVILKGFFEKMNDCKCVIGFKLNPRFFHLYKKEPQEAFTADRVRMLLEKHRQEDDLVDISISPISSFHWDKNLAWIFQLKRFGYFQKEKTTKGLIEMLSKIQKKYVKNQAILVIFFDGHRGISVRAVHRYLRSIEFPFARVMSINTNKNKEGAWKFHIGEMWPTCGYNEYDPEEIIKGLATL